MDPVSPLSVFDLQIDSCTSVGLAGLTEVGDGGQEGVSDNVLVRSCSNAIWVAVCSMLISTEVRRLTTPSPRLLEDFTRLGL